MFAICLRIPKQQRKSKKNCKIADSATIEFLPVLESTNSSQNAQLGLAMNYLRNLFYAKLLTSVTMSNLIGQALKIGFLNTPFKRGNQR